MKYILMVECQSRRNAQQAAGVGRGFNVQLQTLQLGGGQGDIGIDKRRVGLAYIHIDTAEDAERRQAVISIVNGIFVVEVSRADRIQVAQHLLPYLETLRMRDGNLVETELAEADGVLGSFISGILIYRIIQNRISGTGQRVGLEEKIILRETVVAGIPHLRRRTLAFSFQCLFREKVASLCQYPACVRKEGFHEFRIVWKMIMYIADWKAFA